MEDYLWLEDYFVVVFPLQAITIWFKIPHMATISERLYFFSLPLLNCRETFFCKILRIREWVETGLAPSSQLPWSCSPLGWQNPWIHLPPFFYYTLSFDFTHSSSPSHQISNSGLPSSAKCLQGKSSFSTQPIFQCSWNLNLPFNTSPILLKTLFLFFHFLTGETVL